MPAPTFTITLGNHPLKRPDPNSSGPASPKATPSVSIFPPRSLATPTPTPTVSRTVTPSQAKALLRQFRKAQGTALAAVKHRQKVERREFKASHAAQLKEWESRERDARHKYFAAHKSGPERRAYIQSYLQRREVLIKLQHDEEEKQTHDQGVYLKAFRKDQEEKLGEFKQSLSRGIRPKVSLWPSGSP